MRLLISSLLVAVCIAAPLPSEDIKESVSESGKSGKQLFPLHHGTYISGQSVPVNTFHVSGGVRSVAGPTHSVRLAGTGSVVSSVSGGATLSNSVIEPEFRGEYKGAAFAVAGVPTAHIATHAVGTHHTVGAHAVILGASSLGAVSVGTPAVAVHNVGHAMQNVGHLATHSVGTHAFALKSAAVAVGTPSIAVHNVGHAVQNIGHLATHSVGIHAVALKSGAVAVGTPSVALQNVGVSHLAAHSVAIAPAVHAVPSAVTYHSEQTVALPAKEIDVHVQHQTVHVPVEKRVHYGVQNVVTGSQTTVHKPTLNAPAIKAPEVFVAKTRLAAPEVTVTHSETAVAKKSPNYVNAPYDAGVVVEKVAAKFEETHVPTPVEVAQPYAVPKPYAVPVPNVVKTKSVVKPVHHIDVHSVNTENVVTPIEYADHHHVVSQPVHTVHAAQQVHAVQPVQLAHSAHAVHGVAHAALGVGHAAHAVQGVAHSAHGVAHAAHAVHGVTHSAHGVAHAAHAVHGVAHSVGAVHGAAGISHGLRAEGVVQQVHGFVQPGHAMAQGVTYTSQGNAAAHLVGAHNFIGNRNVAGAHQLIVQQQTGQAQQTQFVKQVPGSQHSFHAVSAPVVAPVAVIDGFKAKF